MTPQDALAAALHQKNIGCEWDIIAPALHEGDHEQDADAVLAALPAGWRLTDDPEVTVEALDVDGIVAEMLGAEASLALAKARLRKATDTLAAQANRLRGAS